MSSLHGSCCSCKKLIFIPLFLTNIKILFLLSVFLPFLFKPRKLLTAKTASGSRAAHGALSSAGPAFVFWYRPQAGREEHERMINWY